MTRILLTSSATLFGVMGLVLNFMPSEAAARIGMIGIAAGPLLLQLLAGLMIGMAVMNWMNREGLAAAHGRPLGLANALHFVVGAFALGRALGSDLGGTALTLMFAVYLMFALGFVWTVFFAPTAPVVQSSAEFRR